MEAFNKYANSSMCVILEKTRMFNQEKERTGNSTCFWRVSPRIYGCAMSLISSFGKTRIPPQTKVEDPGEIRDARYEGGTTAVFCRISCLTRMTDSVEVVAAPIRARPR